MNEYCSQIFFARPPLTGKVKTRLSRFIGEERACGLYAAVLKNLFSSFIESSNKSSSESSSKSSSKSSSIETFLFSADKENSGIFSSYGFSSQNIYIQKGKDLGERLGNAFLQLGKNATQKAPILIAGTDCPRYSPEAALQVRRKLEDYDAALGPSFDGGYYIVGLRHHLCIDEDFLKRVFSHSTWSHKAVFQNQKERFEKEKLKVWICPEILEDIDTFSDLILYEKNRQKKPNAASACTLSLKKFIPDIRVILPVLNEAQNLPPIITKLLQSGFFREIICADNGSTDGSADTAKNLGARATLCKKRGYGAACQEALADIRKRGGCDTVLFTDADGSDDLSYMEEILAHTVSGRFDICLGARDPKLSLPRALLAHARFGNWLATRLIHLFWGFRYRDLGPFRAVRWRELESLKMDDAGFGWTIQMQIRSLKKKLRIIEIPVGYRKRLAGKSKVSASIIGSVKAGLIILYVLFNELLFTKKPFTEKPSSKAAF